MARLIATNFSRNGVSDWLLQRLSAVILAAYTFFIVAFLLINNSLNYATWHALFNNFWVQLFTALTALSYLIHCWIGLWTIATDYLKSTTVRLLFLVVVLITLLALLWHILLTLVGI